MTLQFSLTFLTSRTLHQRVHTKGQYSLTLKPDDLPIIRIAMHMTLLRHGVYTETKATWNMNTPPTQWFCDWAIS